MAHFYGEIRGNRSSVTRTGSKQSGIGGHIRGWKIGAEVTVFNDKPGCDVVSVYITHGSNGAGDRLHLGFFSIKDGLIIKEDCHCGCEHKA
jgi:hypothetical protein